MPFNSPDHTETCILTGTICLDIHVFHLQIKTCRQQFVFKEILRFCIEKKTAPYCINQTINTTANMPGKNSHRRHTVCMLNVHVCKGYMLKGFVLIGCLFKPYIHLVYCMSICKKMKTDLQTMLCIMIR